MTTRTFQEPPKPETRRFYIQDLYKHPEARFAVFRRSPSGSRAFFKCVGTDIESAVERARDFAAESAGNGDTDFVYYVVEIKHRIGIENGKPVDEAVK